MFFSIMIGVTGMRASSGSPYFLRSCSGICGLCVFAQTVRKSSASAAPVRGTALADFDDALRRLVEIRAREDEPRHGHVHAIPRCGGQRRQPICPTGAAGSSSSAATNFCGFVGGLLRERVLRFADPMIRHHLQDLRPRLLARLDQFAEQIRHVGLGDDVFRARRRCRCCVRSAPCVRAR